MADEPFFLVRSSSSDLRGRDIINEHQHTWHQLIHVAAGVITVRTARGSWIVPPRWGVWVPAGIDHAIRAVAASQLRTIYVRPGTTFTVSNICHSMAVSPLLREVILRTVDFGMLDERVPVEAALARLIFFELGQAGPASFVLPEPISEELKFAVALIIQNDPRTESTAQLAIASGMSIRTFERRFRTETGMTPGRWQQQYKLLRGLEVIAGGALVKTAAIEAGFTSPSAYVAAFRKAFGITPARYFETRSTPSS